MTDPIAIYQESDYVPECVSHRGQKSLGNKTATSNTSSFTCRTVTSLVSGPNENDETFVTCLNEEVLTGCSSFHVVRAFPWVICQSVSLFAYLFVYLTVILHVNLSPSLPTCMSVCLTWVWRIALFLSINLCDCLFSFLYSIHFALSVIHVPIHSSTTLSQLFSWF